MSLPGLPLALAILLVVTCLSPTTAWSQEEDSVASLRSDVRRLESEVRRLKADASRARHRSTTTQAVQDDSAVALVLMLCGAFCALWAQQTGRNAWLWFFAGLFLNFFTILVLLWKNGEAPAGQSAGRHLAKPIPGDDLA
jgi:outer membrane murein-binding lipoprotein Lpp